MSAAEGAQNSVELRRVIFCTDFSEPSQRALEYALSAAAEFDAELTLLHVLENLPNSADIEEEIATAKKQLDKLIPPEGVKAGKIKTLVRIGRAYEQIIELALETQADLADYGRTWAQCLESCGVWFDNLPCDPVRTLPGLGSSRYTRSNSIAVIPSSSRYGIF